MVKDAFKEHGLPEDFARRLGRIVEVRGPVVDARFEPDRLPALLSAGRRVIAYDRRGHGRSDRPGGGYDFDTLADDLATLINQLGLEHVTLVGHSLGCREIVRYLTRHGSARVERIVFVGTTTPFLPRTDDNPDGIEPALIQANYDAVRANLPKWCTDFEAAGPYFGTTTKDVRGLVEWTIRMIVDTPLFVLLETLRQMTSVDMRPELPRIDVPALIIHGDADASAPIALTGRKTARLMPHARLIEYAGAGHGLYASEHERLNADLLAFLAEGNIRPTTRAA